MKKSEGIQLGVLLVAMLLVSIAVVSAAILPVAKTAKGSMSEQGLKISAISAGPGVQKSWANIPKENISAPKAPQYITVANPYEIGSEKMNELKNQPYVPSGDAIPAIKDTAVDLGSRPLAPTQILGSDQILAPNLLYNFEGLSNLNQTDGGKWKPPDSTIAAGQDYIAVVVNSEIAFYTKTGALAYNTSLENWFSNICSGCYIFDPKIVYDQKEGHWLMMAMGENKTAQQSWYLLSVSQTSFPSSWWDYRLDNNLDYGGIPTWGDYPDIGFDGISNASGGAVYITSNQYNWSTSNSAVFKTAVLNILPKSALYSGSSSDYWIAWNETDSDGAQAFTLRAALTFGNPDGEYLINSKSGGGNSVSLWKVIPTYPPTPVNLVRQATVPIASYRPPPNATQLGCNSTIRTLDNRIYNAVYRNNNLYAAFTDKYNWGNGTVAAIRYLKINTTTNTAAIDSRFGSDGFYFFYPAITVDNSNNIALVFSSSSSTTYAGIRYTGQKATDSSMQPSALLKAGEICNTGYNWGDYSGIGVDPHDDHTVWIYNEWAKNLPGVSSDWDWGTWVGEVTY